MTHLKGPHAARELSANHKPWPGHGCELYASKIREALDAEDWEDDIHGDGSQVRRLFLGSVFGCTPSGKFYMPWACSNVRGCATCAGSGSILNVKRRIAKRRASKWAKDRKRRYMVAGPVYAYDNREQRDAKHAQRMRLYRLNSASTRQCTACGGLGSREAYLDERWREYAESVCESVHASLENGDGDPCDLFITEYRDAPEEEEESDVSEAQPA